MYNIIPQPLCIEVIDDIKVFDLKSCMGIKTCNRHVCEDFTDFVGRAFGIVLSVGNGGISLAYNSSIENKEGYVIDVTKEGISIEASADSGHFYGLQTLKQLLLQGGGRLPQLHIEDEPLYGYRAFMLDTGRYFYPVEEVKRYIRLCALHKLNVFHWHISEDQGWRFESKKYPRLTEKGSRRTHTNFHYFHPRGGFYTQEDVKEIVKYAHSHYMTVVPELDIPGHTVSAIAAYPELGCFGRKIKVATHFGVQRDILCAGKESTYKFVFDIIDEMAELFPDEYFHIGGDEAYKVRWKICPRCQSEMHRLGLGNEDELQEHFMNRVNDYLKGKGYKTVMWNWDLHISPKILSSDIAWNVHGYEESVRSGINSQIDSGRKMICTSSFPYYLDFPYGWVSLRRAYEFSPSEIADEKHKSGILGVEAPLWTEYVPNRARADYQTFPRLAAICESAWTPGSLKNYDGFLDKIGAYYKLLDVYNVGYASLRQANPDKLQAEASSVWWRRRWFHWQHVYIPLRNAYVKARYK